jgi:hypothetical protein
MFATAEEAHKYQDSNHGFCAGEQVVELDPQVEQVAA